MQVKAVANTSITLMPLRKSFKAASTLPTKWLNRKWDVLPTEVAKRIRTISNRHTVSTLLLTLRIISEASKMHTKAATTETSQDKAVKDAIAAAITSIEKIPEPFAKNATSQTTKDAIAAVAKVSNTLSEAANVLNEN